MNESIRSEAADAFSAHKEHCSQCGGPDQWARLATMCAEGRRLLEQYNEAAARCDDEG